MRAHQPLPEEQTSFNVAHQQRKENTFEARKKELIEGFVQDDVERIFTVQTPSSILPLQVVMHFDIIYSVFYSIFLALVSIYKVIGGALVFPPAIWELEFTTIVFFFFIQLFRLYFGYHANRTEHTFSMILFLVATVFSTLFFIYFSFLTTYVLLIELIVGVVGIFFGFVEMLMATYAIIVFQKSNAM